MQQGDPLAQSDQAVPAFRSAAATGPAVKDLNADFLVPAVDRHLAGVGAGMPRHVGARLLEDAVGGDVVVRGQRPWLAPPPHVNADAGGCRGRGQPVDVRQAGPRIKPRIRAPALSAPPPPPLPHPAPVPSHPAQHPVTSTRIESAPSRRRTRQARHPPRTQTDTSAQAAGTAQAPLSDLVSSSRPSSPPTSRQATQARGPHRVAPSP